MDEATALEYFRRWFIEPIEVLKKIERGDGGWIAFITAMALYQRLITAKLKLADVKATDAAVGQEVERDLMLSEWQRRIFWEMFRNGLMHGAMPLDGKTKWAFQDSFTAYPEFKTVNGINVICIHPMKFAERILQQFLDNPKLIIASDSFPWAMVTPLPPELLA